MRQSWWVCSVAVGLLVAGGTPARAQRANRGSGRARAPLGTFELIQVGGHRLPTPVDMGGRPEEPGTLTYIRAATLTSRGRDTVDVRLVHAAGTCADGARPTPELCPLDGRERKLGGPLGVTRSGTAVTLTWPTPRGAKPIQARGTLVGDTLRLAFPFRRVFQEVRPDSVWTVEHVFVRR